MAKWNYLSEAADLYGVSVPSASRILHYVCLAICQQLNNINFPTTVDELKRLKGGFYHQVARFPNVVGTIDGTLIPIHGMSGDDEPNLSAVRVDADLRQINSLGQSLQLIWLG